MFYKRIVVKLGTNLLTGGTNHLNQKVMSNLAQQIARLHHENHELVIVSSGAVAAGREKLGKTDTKRKDIPYKQVLASVGQSQLMRSYEHLFSKHSITIAQALLTKSDLSRRAGYLNARNTLLALIELRVICIVNENDVVSTDEIKETRFGDNDNLSSMVASLIDADLLVLLTDIDGLYTSNPQTEPDAELIESVQEIDNKIQRMASRSAGTRGIGGMATKIEAAKQATSCGITVVIANGLKSGSLKQIVAGERVGTIFHPSSNKIESKKRWILSGLGSKGTIIIDNGASIAIITGNKSLLPAGIIDLEGKFQRGDVVNIDDEKGNHIGCGISNYSSSEIVAIKGVHSNLVSKKLGYEYGSEIIHRNNMAFM
jgi:glutamate 5-kinase